MASEYDELLQEFPSGTGVVSPDTSYESLMADFPDSAPAATTGVRGPTGTPYEEPTTHLGMTTEMIFPRTRKAAVTGEGDPISSAALDISSFPFRTVGMGIDALASLAGAATQGKLPDDLAEVMQSGLSRTGAEPGMGVGEALGEEILRDPANILAAIPPAQIPRASRLAKLPKAVQKAISVAPESATSALIHQVIEPAAAGEELTGANLAAGAAETALGPLMSLIGSGAQSAGSKYLQGTLSPSKKLVQQGVTPQTLLDLATPNQPVKMIQKQGPDIITSDGAKYIIGNRLDAPVPMYNQQKPVAGTLKQMRQALDDRFNQLKAMHSDVIANADKSGFRANLEDLMIDAQNKIATNPELMPLSQQTQKVIYKELGNIARNYSDELKPSDLLQIKRTYGKFPDWTKTGPKDSARNHAYRAIYRAVDDYLDNVTAPGFQALNDEYSKLIPVSDAVTDQILKPTKLPQGITDLMMQITGAKSPYYPSQIIRAGDYLQQSPILQLMRTATFGTQTEE